MIFPPSLFFRPIPASAFDYIISREINDKMTRRLQIGNVGEMPRVLTGSRHKSLALTLSF